MEWVETTGETVDAAVSVALDRLGAHEDDVEIEVLAEPGRRLLRRTEARVRARLRPTAPPAKRERRRRGGSEQRGRRGGGTEGRRRGSGSGGGSDRARTDRDTAGAAPPPTESAAPPAPEPAPAPDRHEETTMTETETVTLDEQVETATEFLEGLLDAMGLEGTVSSVDIEDDLAEVRIEGDQLGLLLGPRGSTLNSLNEVVRTVLQRSAGGNAEGKVRVDVAGYRERRRAALARFAVEQAQKVVETGEARSLEPMNSADRKTVHDALNDVEGVTTSSEGDDPTRWVVISPIE